MKGVVAPRLRRHRPGAAAIAFSHALAVLGDPVKAEKVAVSALRKGAHSRIAILAHARFMALDLARGADLEAKAVPVASDLRLAAAQLAGTRPPLERAIVDLELRYGLDATSFARVLGVSADRAAERSAAVAAAWSDNLDPAMMAWLGPGSCPDLQVVLSNAGVWPRHSSTGEHSSGLAATGTDNRAATLGPSIEIEPSILLVRELLSVAPAVAAHTDVCEVCGQRLALLTPVRTVVGQSAPGSVPSQVTGAARAARRRLAGPLPPSIEPRRIDVARLRTALFLSLIHI